MAISIDMAQVERLEGMLTAGTPMFVLNLLRFREKAAYPEGITPAGETGREAYFNGYVPAFGTIAAEHGVSGVKPIWIGSVAAHFAASPSELWDLVVIVEYPSVESFRRIVDTEAYRARAEPMRKAALEDWRLIAQTRMELPA